uniref:N-ethylammeline chlorohydrolase n=1 Tax=uncultured Alphaproteobacteria bacterium TaxID=91750 RepID=A0A6G8F3A1_9PROT|nr:N-ethylammeline chlorohydrolase [uncultured Alphaproteobacteria bacterium]
MSILIKNVLHNGNRTNVYIKNNRFSTIAPDFEISADKVIDGSRKAVVPAFYNTHNHAAMSILRGYGDDKPLFEWLTEDIWPIEDQLSPEDIYTASRLALLEMIKSGTVFFADMYFFGEQTMRAVDEMGMRAAISRVEMDMFDAEKTAQKKNDTADFINFPNPCPERIIKCLSCHAVYTVSDELFAYARQVAAEQNWHIQIHLSETKKENDDCFAKWGMSPTAKLDSLGMLTPKTILAHAVHLSDDDIRLIKDRGCFLSTNTTSNLKLNSGLFMFERLFGELPEHVTLGTDGASSNNNLSMIEAMKICSLAAKLEAGSAVAGKAADVFQAATRNGALAFGLDAGEIREGALADCLLVDLDNPFLTPNYNLISNLVYAADSSCISDAICDGRVIMENRRVAGEEDIISSSQILAEKIKKLKK